jgi:hypothetical protein
MAISARIVMHRSYPRLVAAAPLALEYIEPRVRRKVGKYEDNSQGLR